MKQQSMFLRFRYLDSPMFFCPTQWYVSQNIDNNKKRAARNRPVFLLFALFFQHNIHNSCIGGRHADIGDVAQIGKQILQIVSQDAVSRFGVHAVERHHG